MNSIITSLIKSLISTTSNSKVSLIVVFCKCLTADCKVFLFLITTTFYPARYFIHYQTTGKMFKLTVLFAFLASAVAFAPVRVSRATTSVNMETMSKSVPFLKKPKNLDGLVVSAADQIFPILSLSNILWLPTL